MGGREGVLHCQDCSCQPYQSCIAEVMLRSRTFKYGLSSTSQAMGHMLDHTLEMGILTSGIT
jgi:hypothetical protein